MESNFTQIALYLLFILSSLAYFQSRLMSYKKKAQSLTIFVFDTIRTFTLPVALAFISMAFSYKTFWLAFLSVSFLLVFIAIVWANWEDED
jgi:L-asparagine transporter-like permease